MTRMNIAVQELRAIRPFTAQELRVIRHAVAATYEEPRSELLAKIDVALAAQEPGPLVFELELAIWSTVKTARQLRRRGDGPPPPRLFAPTLNEYKGLKHYELSKLRAAMDEAILRARGRFRHASCGVIETASISRVTGKPVRRREGGRRRVVVVLRESNRPPDELSTDAIGGKMPIDRLVAAQILRDDTSEWVIRVPRWKQVPPGDGRVVVSVYEAHGEPL